MFDDPARIDTGVESRSISFENPTGARGAGGTAHGGRKGAPNRRLGAGERVVLADIKGPGRVRHIWLTIPPMPPEVMRAVVLEVFYNGLDAPSISVPALDFFGVPHGRPAPYASYLTAVQEGRGFNSYIPMPFLDRIRIELANASTRSFPLYYQVDYTLEAPRTDDIGYLHVAFRRENPTTMTRDFVIAEGHRGPGRFLGCVVGVRVLPSEFAWYGEGEVKIYLDGDKANPTICGTGLEDYVGSAWGMGRHTAPFQGVPVLVRDPHSNDPNPDFVGFYRWHVPDPVIFRDDLTVTIQQIGAVFIPEGEKAEKKLRDIERAHPVAGPGWHRNPSPGMHAWGIAERVDDYCAASFVVLREPQAVAPVDVPLAVADVDRRPYERPSATERQIGALGGE